MQWFGMFVLFILYELNLKQRITKNIIAHNKNDFVMFGILFVEWVKI